MKWREREMGRAKTPEAAAETEEYVGVRGLDA
jgi:hypothetical protein